jgi:predicted regulator of Ras-like GTPase activity (Roadblock/LC7/MglB family)
MADPVMDAYTQAYNDSGKKIQAFGVITTNGRVLWQSNNWNLTNDAASLSAAVSQRATSVVQNQVKYSTIRTTPESLVARSVSGNGTLILARIDNDKFVIAWAAADAAPDQVYVDVDRAAKRLKGKI